MGCNKQETGVNISYQTNRWPEGLASTNVTPQHCKVQLVLVIEFQNWQAPPLAPFALHRFPLSTCDRCFWRSHGEHYAACDIVQHDQVVVSLIVWGSKSMEARTDLYNIGNSALTAIRD